MPLHPLVHGGMTLEANLADPQRHANDFTQRRGSLSWIRTAR
ncbi:hypothetical protein ACIBQX_19030 [Nonomuraea sp. NPDC049714]